MIFRSKKLFSWSLTNELWDVIKTYSNISNGQMFELSSFSRIFLILMNIFCLFQEKSNDDIEDPFRNKPKLRGKNMTIFPPKADDERQEASLCSIMWSKTKKNSNEKPSQQKKIVIFKNTDFFEHQNHYQI